MNHLKTRDGRILVLPDDGEERRIQAGIEADPDNPELDAHFFAHARAAREVLGDVRVNALVARRLRHHPD